MNLLDLLGEDPRCPLEGVRLCLAAAEEARLVAFMLSLFRLQIRKQQYKRMFMTWRSDFALPSRATRASDFLIDEL